MTPAIYEKLIIRLLFKNEDVRDKIFPFLNVNLFDSDYDTQNIVKNVLAFSDKYDRFPNVTEIKTFMKDDSTSKAFSECLAMDAEEYDTDFMMSEIEDFFKRKLLWNNAEQLIKTLKSESIIEAGAVPESIMDSLSFSFDTGIGFDFFDDPDRLYDSLTLSDKVVPSRIKAIDSLIEGGFHEKSLTLFLAGTNVGKTLIMCALASNMIMHGHDVLYVTFEDSEEKIANRITFNLLDADKTQLKAMSKEAFMRRFEHVKKMVKQKLIIKEFPEYTIGANHLRQLLKDLKIKKKFIPRIMFIDYIGCMLPNGKQNTNLNSNDLLRLVAGQTRAVGMEYSMPIVSGAQTNRGGSTSSEIDLTDTADSFGQTMKADVIFGVTETPELAAAGIYTFFLLKSRYGLKGMKISVGVDKFKQRLFDVVGDDEEQPRSKDLVDDAVVTLRKTGNKEIKNISFE